MLISRKDYEYMLGTYLGDGSKYNDYGIRVVVANKDVNYLVELEKILSPYTNYKRSYKGKDGHRYGYAQIFANSPELVKNFHPYKHNYLWTLPKLKYPAELIAGVFDTDGTVRRREWVKNPLGGYEIVIYQKNRENLELLIPYMNELFLYPTFRKFFRKSGLGNVWGLCISHPTQVEIFRRQIPSRHLRKRVTLGFPTT